MPEEKEKKEKKEESPVEEVELADGTKINVVKEDKFKEVQEGHTKSQTELQTELETAQTDLEKEKEKEKNFANLRKKKLDDLSDEQKEKLSDEKKEIMEMREQYDTDRAEDKKARAESWKKAAYQELGVMDADGKVTDEDAHKRLDTAFSRFNDPEDSAVAVLRKAKSAWSLEFGNDPNIGERTINSAIPFGGGGDIPKKAEEFNEVQKGVASLLDIDLEGDKE